MKACGPERFAVPHHAVCMGNAGLYTTVWSFY